MFTSEHCCFFLHSTTNFQSRDTADTARSLYKASPNNFHQKIVVECIQCKSIQDVDRSTMMINATGRPFSKPVGRFNFYGAIPIICKANKTAVPSVQHCKCCYLIVHQTIVSFFHLKTEKGKENAAGVAIYLVHQLWTSSRIFI